ncbi:MAG: right-handed parallel beta-helix repeat-containing protein [Promethearchaeota archaeon]
MKAKIKAKIFISVTLVFIFFPIISTSFKFGSGSRDKHEIILEIEGLKMSKISMPLYINDNDPSFNWSVAKDAGICTGNGTKSDPYILEDLIIDGGLFANPILIRYSSVYFRIENCTLYNASIYQGGIYLNFVENGHLLYNNCSLNYHGILLFNCENNIISGNIANNNTYGSGIYILRSHNNNISGNIANNNYLSGIELEESNFNNVTGSTLIVNRDCITEKRDCTGNIFSDNGDCTYEGLPPHPTKETIPGYNILSLLGILSVGVIMLSKKIRKS